jgi:CRP/FNR family transcriptional regulator
LERLEKYLVVKELPKGALLFMAGEKPDNLHLLLEGRASVFKTTRKGREIVINSFEAPAVIAELANLTGSPFPASCKMEEDGRVGFLPFRLVEELLKREGLCYGLLSSLARKMWFLDKLIHENLVIDTDAKVAKFIYEHGELLNDLKHYQIASLLNIKPETLSRKLAKFKQLGILKKEEGRWVVVDREKLPDLFPWE